MQAYRYGPVSAFQYRYELRRGKEIVATGHLTYERPVEVGDRVAIGAAAGIVRAVDPVLGERELRLVVEISHERVDA